MTDSPLSITGNVTNILTFALGVFSFCAAFYAITYNAPQEIQDYRASLSERRAHIDEIHQYFNRLDMAADSQLEGTPMNELIKNSLDGLTRRWQAMEDDLLKVNGRLQWWYRRQDMATAMARIEAQLQHLNAIQLTFLLLKMKRQSTQLDEQERLLGKLIPMMNGTRDALNASSSDEL